MYFTNSVNPQRNKCIIVFVILYPVGRIFLPAHFLSNSFLEISMTTYNAFIAIVSFFILYPKLVKSLFWGRGVRADLEMVPYIDTNLFLTEKTPNFMSVLFYVFKYCFQMRELVLFITLFIDRLLQVRQQKLPTHRAVSTTFHWMNSLQCIATKFRR